jgi:NitT/TauT family transport system substrate-binding protein
VRLGFSAWPGWFPWQVAQEEKIFDTNKVAVDLKWFDGYLESISTLAAGQIDANSQTLNDTISSVAGGADQVVVLVNDNSTGNDKIIVRDGISAVADLKGKKVAAEEGTVDHFLLLLGLEKAGLSAKDITFVPLETGKAAAAFVAGQVDAVGVFAPFTTQALKRPGSKELFSSKEFPGAIPDHLVFSRKFVTEHPDRVQAMVDSWFATLDYMQKSPDKAIEIMAKRAGVSVDEYKAYADGTKIFTIEENLTAFQPGSSMASLPYAAEQMSKFLMDVGLAKTKPDLSKLFDDRFVKAYAEKVKKS